MAYTSILKVFHDRARTDPDGPFLTFNDRLVSAREFDERTTRVGLALEASGVRPGDRVAILDQNRAEHLEVLVGAGKARAAYLPLNWRLAAEELAYILRHSAAKLVVAGRSFLPLLEASVADERHPPRVVVLDDPGSDGYTGWLAAAPATDSAGTTPTQDASPDDVALQMYTSGTTGLPKGVMLTHRNLSVALALGLAWDLGPESVALVCMPLFHMSGTGWAITALFGGGRIVLLRDPDPAEILRTIGAERVTHALLVPALMQVVMDHPATTETDFSSLRLMVYGGSPIPEDVLARGLQTFGCGFMQLYGLTESTGTGTVLEPADHLRDQRLLRSVGRPPPGIELRVVDPNTDDDCHPGQVGEVWLRSAMVMKGYWRAPRETGEVLSSEGWLRTGDAGYLDDEGYLFLHDRVKDMIVSGGENVYPAEVERVLRTHASVVDVAVVGVPDRRWGETVKAVVVARPGVTPDQHELIEHCRARLAHYKCPTSVDFVADLPRNAAGKVLKRQVRDPYWQGHARRVN